ncbi:CDP-alcohol phosphatidyltransferase family protein [Streptomyces sp. N2-109]|uniref:CDP-alcohol phosphatidyltransferase family protein n=1 Tax=Streptomyces gossypii TaxID=2883101 RepID=A0ABT2JVL3_9ACTN|nr:CDP-alcohol phosphatidyltransferase family protein [Streptomyces gossypii]MCT2591708.1 CDP-alcohol phosphatidyltransferase family protein [Streptomyces gossypii]
MPTAILTGPPVAGSPLESGLRALGFDVRVAADDAAVRPELAALPSGERVALVDTRFVGHAHSLRLALTDPRFPAGAVPGALTVQPEARAALTRALDGAAAAPAAPAAHRAGPETGARTAADGATQPDPQAGTRTGTAEAAVCGLPDTLADRLTADGVTVHRPELGVLVATVPGDPAARSSAEEAVAATDDEAVRLRGAVKARDGFFTTFCISPYSRYLARWCARRGLTPNQVTTASLITALIAAAAAATGTRGGFVAAGVLLLASFVLDCTDGQLARYSLQYSTMGAWLDATFDRAKEYAYYAGLALGAARGGDDVWALALGAMVLQTARHVVDFSFTEANHDATANTSPTAALSDRLDSAGWTVWVRRMIVLPIGERWAMIAVLTACTTPRITLWVLLAGCALAACYTTAGRVLRSLTRAARRTDRAAQALADLADSGPLATAVANAARGFAAPVIAALGGAVVVATALWTPMGSWWPVLGAAVYAVTSGIAVAAPLKGALDWLAPPLFRIAEYSTILVLAARSEVNGALPAAFGLVAAVAYHHYDTVYRIRGGTGAPPHWLVRAVGGHEGRTLVVTVVAAFRPGGQGFTIALTMLCAVIAVTVLSESIRFWVSSKAPAVHDESGEPA